MRPTEVVITPNYVEYYWADDPIPATLSGNPATSQSGLHIIPSFT
jgi:hypothetical protein